jgi:GT2 family glycosyltransferase
MESKFAKFSILLLNYNGKKIIVPALDSIKRLNYPSEKIETIVVDNNSTDGSIPIIKKNYPFAKIIKMNENLAFGAFNHVWKYCSGDFIFFQNNDIEFDKNCILELNNSLNPSLVAIAPAVYDMQTRKVQYTKKFISRSFYNGSNSSFHQSKQKNLNNKIEAYTGGIVLKRKFIETLPFVFDPNYFLYVEDIDLAYRIRLLGHEIYRVPKSILYHKAHETTKTVFNNSEMNYLIERNTIQTYLKNLETKNLFFYLPIFISLRMGKLLINLLSFKFNIMKSTFKAWNWNLKNIGLILKKRKVIQSNRKVSDKLIFKKMGSEMGVLKYILKNSCKKN